jgi:lactoylglutathione lyase
MKAKLTYTGIRVKNLEESIEFYTKVLGMKVIERGEVKEAEGKTAVLVSEDGGPRLELNYYRKGSQFDKTYIAGEGLDHLAFRVDDLDQALAEAKKAGHPTVIELKTATSRWAYIEDPDGIFIELFA